MVSITLSVPEEVRETMKKFPEINWSGLVRTCIIEKAELLKMKEKLLSDLDKEKEFNEWAVNLGRKAKKGRFKNLSK
jgi:hypothetical protein